LGDGRQRGYDYRDHGCHARERSAQRRLDDFDSPGRDIAGGPDEADANDGRRKVDGRSDAEANDGRRQVDGRGNADDPHDDVRPLGRYARAQ